MSTKTKKVAFYAAMIFIWIIYPLAMWYLLCKIYATVMQ